MTIHFQECDKVYLQGSERVTAAQQVTVDFRPGINIILGKSGSGKSTILGLASGLLTPSNGQVFWGNKAIYHPDVDRCRLRRESAGFVFQNDNLISELTVRDNILIPMRLQSRQINEEEMTSLAQILGIENKLDYLPCELSGGEQQRTAIARAVIHQPSLIFADEPTGSLDAVTAQNTAELLASIVKRSKSNLILVTHDQDWLYYADAVFHMERGRLSAC